MASVADPRGETQSGNSIALEVKAVATGGGNAKLATAPMGEGRWQRRPIGENAATPVTEGESRTEIDGS